MFIFWGSRANRQQLGYVADFCPLCRGIEAHRLLTVSKVSHLYGLSLGKGEILGHITECRRCSLQLQKNVAAFVDVAKSWKAGNSMDELIATTLPNARQLYSSRLQLENVVLNKPESLEAGARRKLMKEVFELLAPVLDRQLKKTQVGFGTLVTFILAGAAVIGAGILMSSMKVSDSTFNSTLTALGIAGFVAVGFQGVLGRRQFRKRRIYPHLAYGLRPLKPSKSELDAALKELQRLGFVIARKVKSKDLLAAMQAADKPLPRLA